MKPAETQRPRSIDLGIVCIITVIAAALRFHALAARPFWFDEGISVGIAKLDWASFARLLWQREANMSLYYVLLRGWMFFGGSEFFVRGFSALVGTVTVPLLYLLGRWLFNSQVGLIAAGLLAVNSYHIRYSQEARAYALVMFMAVICAYFFADYVRSSGRRGGMATAATGALLVYCHFYGALFLAAQMISLFLVRPLDFNWKDAFRNFRWFLYFVFPLIAFVVVRGSSQMLWVPRISIAAISDFFRLYTGNRGWPLEILFAAAGLAAAWACREQWVRNRFSFETWAQVSVWISLVFPLGLVLAISIWKPLFIARYMIFCLPPLILIAGVGISRARIPAIQFLALAAFAIFSVQGVLRYYAQDFDIWREDWRSASQFLLANARADDGVIFYPGPARMSYEFYKSIEHPMTPPRIIYPAHSSKLNDKDFLVQPLAEVIESLPEDAPRVWIAVDSPGNTFDGDTSLGFLRTWCERRYHQIELKRFEGVELILYRK